MEKKNNIQRDKSKDYPAHSVIDAIGFIEKFKSYPSNRPISYDSAAKEMSLSAATSSFKYMLSAARQFGLIKMERGRTFILTDLAVRIIRPTEENDEVLRNAQIECFKTAKLYSELIKQYQGQSLPTGKTLENVLVNYHGITAKAAAKAADVFIRSANEIGIVINGVLDLHAFDEEYPKEDVETNKTDSKEDEASHIFNSGLPTDSFHMPGIEVKMAAPLTIPLGGKRAAILYMPEDACKNDAEYVSGMIGLMFKQLYEL